MVFAGTDDFQERQRPGIQVCPCAISPIYRCNMSSRSRQMIVECLDVADDSDDAGDLLATLLLSHPESVKGKQLRWDGA